jgi:hypothetical protein
MITSLITMQCHGGKYKGHLKCLWIHLVILSWNFVRCNDGLFFKVPPLASDALLTMLHQLLENVLQTIYCKLQEDSGTGGFDFSHSFLHL